VEVESCHDQHSLYFEPPCIISIVIINTIGEKVRWKTTNTTRRLETTLNCMILCKLCRWCNHIYTYTLESASSSSQLKTTCRHWLQDILHQQNEVAPTCPWRTKRKIWMVSLVALGEKNWVFFWNNGSGDNKGGGFCKRV
jgi:hypothetical protein